MKKIIILAIIAATILGLYFFVFSRGDWDNDDSLSPVDTSGDQKYIKSLTDQDVKNIIFDTLPENIFQPEFKGKIFCANHLFGYEENKNENLFYIYIYAHCEEYFLKGEEIVLGKGVASPIKMVFKYEKDNLLFQTIESPKDGPEYERSISVMFPEMYVREALNGIDVSTLIPSPKTQADNYYKGKLEVYF